MPVSKDSSIRILELDVLRGFAALGVLIFHYTVVYPFSYNPNEVVLFKFDWGYYGINLFFMISGFVIFMTLEKISSPLDFIVSRFSRLFPCYWAAVLLTFTVIQKFSLFNSSLMEVSPKEALLNLTMLEDWIRVKRVDGVYWTLEVELLFYVLMLIVLVTKSKKYIEIWGGGWLCLMVLNKYLPFGWPFFDELRNIFNYMLIHGNLFFAGILFYNLRTKGNAWYRHLGIAACLVVNHVIGMGTMSFQSLVFFFIIFYLFTFHYLGFIIQKPLVWLGTISYSLYLTHSVIGFVILENIDVYEQLGVFKFNPYFNFFIPLTCSLIIATLLTYLVERPCMKWIRQTYKRIR